MRGYKLYLNVSKQVVYEKPIITEITIAKHRIKDLLNERLIFELTEISNESETEGKQFRGSISIRSNSLITQFKTIIKECKVEYKDMLNYSLAIVEGNSEKIIKKYQKSVKDEKQLVKAIIEILDFVFFIYSVSPRVNTTIKLCRILAFFIYFTKNERIKNDFKSIIFKSIFDNIGFILNKNKHNENTQVETLYLLLILAELGKNYWLDSSILSGYFGIHNNSGEYCSEKYFNYFSLTVLLFYIKNKVRYDGIRKFIEIKIKEKFVSNKKLIWKDTELTLLLMDTLACPYVSGELKEELLNIYDVTDKNLQSEMINIKEQWFTTWKNFNFRNELDAKRSKEVC